MAMDGDSVWQLLDDVAPTTPTTMAVGCSAPPPTPPVPYTLGNDLLMMMPTLAPLCYHEFEKVWLLDKGWHLREKSGRRRDYWERPVGVVVVEETRYFNVVVPLPVWRLDQVESLKRCWCEVVRDRMGVWPRTHQFHVNVWGDGGSAPRESDMTSDGGSAPRETTSDAGAWCWASMVGPMMRDGWWPISGCRLRVVFDKEPTFIDVPAGHQAWPPARFRSALAVPLLRVGGALAAADAPLAP